MWSVGKQPKTSRTHLWPSQCCSFLQNSHADRFSGACFQVFHYFQMQCDYYFHLYMRLYAMIMDVSGWMWIDVDGIWARRTPSVAADAQLYQGCWKACPMQSSVSVTGVIESSIMLQPAFIFSSRNIFHHVWSFKVLITLIFWTNNQLQFLISSCASMEATYTWDRMSTL